MKYLSILLLFLFSTQVYAQTNPGFVDGLTLCADTASVYCQGNPPYNSLGLNQAFANKADYPLLDNTIPNIAALSAIQAATSLEATTLGYYSAGDGGNASYSGQSSACSKNAGAGDGVSQILGASSTCWLLLDSGDISVKVGGAKCDGTTNDTVRIQATLDRTSAGTSSYIPISANGCVITATLKLNFPYSRFHGLGAGSLIVGGQGATDPAFLLVDIISTADHSSISNLRINAKIVSTNVNPTMCALTVTPGNYPIFGQGIFVEGDDSVVSDIWGTNTYDNLIGIGRVACATGTATAGSPSRVNVSRIQSVNNGRGSHTGTTHWGGAAVDNLGGGANISDVTDTGSNSCAVLDLGDGATGSFTNIWCTSPQVDPSGAGGNCLYAGSAHSNFSNVFCNLATGPQAVFIDASAQGVQFNNLAIAAPAFNGVLIKSSTGAGFSPDDIKITNLNLTDVSFLNSGSGSGVLIDTTAGGNVTNLMLDMTVSAPVGTSYNAYGFVRTGSGTLTGWGTMRISSGLTARYGSIPSTFKVQDISTVATAPTVTSCGSGASLNSGTQLSGIINVGSTNPTTSCTLNFDFFGWPQPANCTFNEFGSSSPILVAIMSRTWSNPNAFFVIVSASDIHGQFISYVCN